MTETSIKVYLVLKMMSPTDEFKDLNATAAVTHLSLKVEGEQSQAARRGLQL